MFDNFVFFLGAWHTKWQNLARSSVIFRASSSTEGTFITSNSYRIFTWSLKLQVVTLLNNKKFCLIGNYIWSIRHSVRLINERRSLYHSQSKVACQNFFGLWLLKHWKIRIAYRQWRSNFPRSWRKPKFGKKNRELRIQWLW